mmetsp:Transcript_39782/g.64737  ORF Transcript_39782/g.64737 Transcript_39782/m.64737 type:complete len:98 (-) Transcript_39782:16-309(-)
MTRLKGLRNLAFVYGLFGRLQSANKSNLQQRTRRKSRIFIKVGKQTLLKARWATTAKMVHIRRRPVMVVSPAYGHGKQRNKTEIDREREGGRERALE